MPFSGTLDTYSLFILPVIIFFARICDVTIGTIRIIMVNRGKRKIAPLLGFCEVFIWIVAINQIMKGVASLPAFIGYAAGFATGNYVGMLIEDRLAIGTVIIRTILPTGGTELARLLNEAGFGVTTVDAEGATGHVKIIYTIVKRKDIKRVTAIIHQINPKAFLSIEDVRSTEEGVFPQQENGLADLFDIRKAK